MTTDNNTPSDDAFAARVTSSLDRRAAGLDVHSSIDEIYDRAAVPDDGNVTSLDGQRRSLTGPMRTVLAAAAVLIVGLTGVLGVSRFAEGGEEFAIQDAVSEALTAGTETNAPPSNGEAIVWLDVGVDPEDLSAVRDWLDQDPTVSVYRYVDEAETYAEFREYFADEPEILEMVTPRQLPTSFIVTTDDPIALIRTAEILPGVQDVQTGEEFRTDARD